MSETELDEQYERAERRAEELTEQNRAALQDKAQKDRETAIDAMTEYLENVPLREIAEQLWIEREHELTDGGWRKLAFLNGTNLARWFKHAAEQYAKDNAVKVYAQTLLDAEMETAADAAIDYDQQRDDK